MINTAVFIVYYKQVAQETTTLSPPPTPSEKVTVQNNCVFSYI